jgi:hypothetical protein
MSIETPAASIDWLIRRAIGLSEDEWEIKTVIMAGGVVA